MIRVSVIIPVYNAASYLPRCLDSVLGQTLKDIEVICVDDGSTDGSAAILADYAAKDSRVKVITQRNVGAGAARNVGIRAATGEYVGFVDSDDFIDPDFYARLYEGSDCGRTDCVKGTILLYDNETGASHIEEWLDIHEWVKKDKAYFAFTFTTAIYKREVVLRNNVEFLEGRIHFEDPYFTIKGALFFRSVRVVDSVCYYYCENRLSTSRQVTPRHATDFCKGVKDVLSLLESCDAPKSHYLIVFDFVIGQLATWCCNSGVGEDARRTACDTYALMLKSCRYLEDWVAYHFSHAWESHRMFVIHQLRRRLLKW